MYVCVRAIMICTCVCVCDCMCVCVRVRAIMICTCWNVCSHPCMWRLKLSWLSAPDGEGGYDVIAQAGALLSDTCSSRWLAPLPPRSAPPRPRSPLPDMPQLWGGHYGGSFIRESLSTPHMMAESRRHRTGLWLIAVLPGLGSSLSLSLSLSLFLSLM